MTNISLDGQVAILIDTDNIQPGYLEKVLEISEYYGELIIRCAFGIEEESAQTPRMKEIAALKIEYEPNRHVGEHAADGYLLIKVGTLLEGMSSEGSPNVFIIVSGDGIYASACMMIRESGKQIICIGNKKQMSDNLKTYCDEYYFFEDLDSELKKLRQIHPILPNEVRAFNMALFLAYHRLLSSKKWDWVYKSQLQEKLNQMAAESRVSFDKYRLSTWLKNFTTEFRDNGQQVRRIDPYPKIARLNAIKRAYHDARRLDNSALINTLDQTLRKSEPNYEFYFGSKKLAEWLRDYPDKFILDGDRVIYRDYWIGATSN